MKKYYKKIFIGLFILQRIMKSFYLPSSNQSKNTKIVFQEEGKASRELNNEEVVEMLTSQQKQLSQMGHLKDLYGNSLRENARLKEIIETQQKILDEKNLYINELEMKITMYVMNKKVIMMKLY